VLLGLWSLLVPRVSAMSLIVPLQSFYATLTSILPSQYGWYCDQHSFFLYLGKCIDGRITLLQRSIYSSAHKVSFRFDLQLAYQNGIVPTAGDYILLVIAATVGSSKSAHHTIQSIFVSAIAELLTSCLQTILFDDHHSGCCTCSGI